MGRVSEAVGTSGPRAITASGVSRHGGWRSGGWYHRPIKGSGNIKGDINFGNINPLWVNLEPYRTIQFLDSSRLVCAVWWLAATHSSTLSVHVDAEGRGRALY